MNTLKNIQNSVTLHQGITTLRSLLVQHSLAQVDSSKVILTNHTNHTFEFTLNRPKALNSIDPDVVRIINGQLKKWKTGMKSPRVVLMCGSGQKAFCAGGDIVSMYKGYSSGQSLEDMERNNGAYTLMHYSLATMVPIQIAFWDGIVMGGGIGCSQHSKIRICTEKTVYAMPETAIGFFTDVGASYFLPRIGLPLALYVALTGQRFSANELLQTNLATHFVPSAKIQDLK